MPHTTRSAAPRDECALPLTASLSALLLATQDPTPAQLGQIREAIEGQTAARAGSQKAVSARPIFLRLYSPYVPNLNLVDLPGLTMTALTAQGQPKDIKEQIRAMVKSFIAPTRKNDPTSSARPMGPHPSHPAPYM